MTVFEVLTQHLLYRLTHNEALGEEIPTRMAQVAYMLALPGVRETRTYAVLEEVKLTSQLPV